MVTFLYLLALSIFIGCIWGYLKEKKDFNDGKCPRCGTNLKYFDTDSQGGQGWTCDKCGYTTWVSWFNPLNDRKYGR